MTILTAREKDDNIVSPAIEAGAMALMASSPTQPIDNPPEEWLWLHTTPAIRNRWRRRFKVALEAAMKVEGACPKGC